MHLGLIPLSCIGTIVGMDKVLERLLTGSRSTSALGQEEQGYKGLAKGGKRRQKEAKGTLNAS